MSNRAIGGTIAGAVAAFVAFCVLLATTWVSRGGQTLAWNVVPACGSCNSSKGNRDPIPWIRRGGELFPGNWDSLIGLAAMFGDGFSGDNED